MLLCFISKSSKKMATIFLNMLTDWREGSNVKRKLLHNDLISEIKKRKLFCVPILSFRITRIEYNWRDMILSKI